MRLHWWDGELYHEIGTPDRKRIKEVEENGYNYLGFSEYNKIKKAR